MLPFLRQLKNDMTSCGRYIFMPAFENLSYDDVGIKGSGSVYIQSYIYTWTISESL